jgi:2,3-bisphosphoglycerate-dependent phosphoglycerate mutase
VKGRSDAGITGSILRRVRRVGISPAAAKPDAADDGEWDGEFLDDLRNGWINGYTKAKQQDDHRYTYSDMLEARGTWFNKLFARRPSRPGSRGYDKEENEDGWGEMRKKRRPLVARVLRNGLKGLRSQVFSDKVEPGTLILIRHGESVWNANKTFTGWADPDLSERGYREVEHAARLLLEGGYDIDVAFTSRLKRAIRSVWIILQELNRVYLPVFKSWRLNERHYGALTGLSKTETAARLGRELVQDWRGSLYSRPPALKRSDAYWPGKDRKYADLSADQIPFTESLLDCMERTSPLWEQKVCYELLNGRNVLIVAHANTLRGLVKRIDNIGDDDIQEVAIPTGIPIIYKFDKDLKPIPPSGDRQTTSQVHMNGLFLEKPGLLKEALKREFEWRKQVPGYQPTMELTKTPMSALERSLYKLRASRELGEWAGQFFDATVAEEDDGNDGNFGRPILFEDQVWELGMQELRSGGQFDPDSPAFHAANGQAKAAAPVNGESSNADEEEGDVKAISIPLYSNSPCVASFPSESIVPGLGQVPVRRDAVVVIIRHGKTEHNKLGLFTGMWLFSEFAQSTLRCSMSVKAHWYSVLLGWEDAPLAKDGIDEARAAGRLLKAHGFEFDVVYSSWLSRAIETALYVLDELDSLWLPMIKV